MRYRIYEPETGEPLRYRVYDPDTAELLSKVELNPDKNHCNPHEPNDKCGGCDACMLEQAFVGGYLIEGIEKPTIWEILMEKEPTSTWRQPCLREILEFRIKKLENVIQEMTGKPTKLRL